MSTISDAIETRALKPQRVKGEAGEIEQHPLPDVIEADRYSRAVKASSNASRGIRFSKFVPPGTVGGE